VRRNPTEQARIDCAAFGHHGLEGISNLKRLSETFVSVAEGLSQESVLELLINSAHPDKLLLRLIDLPSYKHDAVKVERLAILVYGLRHDDFTPDSISVVIDRYWSLRVRNRILQNDYRRAWDEVKLTHKQTSVKSLADRESVLPWGMTASHELSCTLVSEIFDLMSKKFTLKPVTSEYEPCPYLFWSSNEVPKIAGVTFVKELGCADRAQGINRTGQMIMRIAQQLNNERREQRRRRRFK
jgi:hypothetical protein